MMIHFLRSLPSNEIFYLSTQTLWGVDTLTLGRYTLCIGSHVLVHESRKSR